ncbi:YdeI/OmpD-associated family protein [Actinomadura sp. 9N407]|uniref:YdeI/OmpD-associated family protein n=1 Tax=Actinomadura sp. 9N407 TaxID=3375154 RepID=UPI0037AB8CC2
MKIRVTLELGGKTATGFAVPEDVVLGLGAGKRPPVKVTINGYTYRSTVAPMGGRYLIGVNAGNREAAGVSAGQEVDVELELDTEPRVVSVPADLAEALAAEPEAERFFESLSYSKKSWFVLSVEGAKKAETRQRRITDAVTMLKEGRSSR